MLKMSGRTKLIFGTLFKLILSMVIGCAIMLSMLFVLYKPTYEVKLGNEVLGYISNKKVVEDKIEDFLQNGDKENVGYVILKEEPTYEFNLVKKEINTRDDEVVARVISECDVYYRVYAVNVDEEEKFVVETVKEAQEVSDKIAEEQKEFKLKANVEISEKFVKDYKLLDDTQVVVNDVIKKVKEENDKIVKKTTTYAAKTTRTVPQDVLVALKESNVELSFRRPLNAGVGVITSRYGIRSMGNHKGLDIAAPVGTPIYASEAGVVTYSGWMSGYGYLIIIQHAAGYQTYYGHCSKLVSNVGDEVGKGDLIAYVGNTGRSTGPHVHFEVRINGVTYNPEKFLSE